MTHPTNEVTHQKQRSSFNLSIRSISLFLIAAFFLQDISWAGPVGLGAIYESPLQGILHNPSRLKISPSIANVVEFFNGPRKDKGTAPLLIHIQDAHTNLSAQNNLANVLEELIQKYKLKTVFIEGGAEDDSLTFLRKTAPKNVRAQVGKKYLMKGELNGAEYLNLISDHPMEIQGVEDPKLYDQSLR